MKGMLYKLLKAFYDFKQVTKLWYKRLSKFLFKKPELQQINANHSIFISKAGINGLIVCTFIDDIKIMGVKDFAIITQVKWELTTHLTWLIWD